MSISYDVYTRLKEIVDKTYPNKEIPNFRIEVIAKELKSKYGDYSWKDKKIRILNLSIGANSLVTTALHELSHHCERAMYGSTGHKKEHFYEVFRDLLATGIKIGIINYEEARNAIDGTDIRMLEKYFGKIEDQYDETMDDRKNLSTIKVENSFNIREQLKAREYSYDGMGKFWKKDILNNEVEKEKVYLLSLDNKIVIKVHSATQLVIEAVYYVCIYKCFEHKDKLKEMGYMFRGYNIKKDNPWVKKIKAAELEDEKKLLKDLAGIEIKIITPK